MLSPAEDTEGEALRVLVASHSHPRVQNGGSEVASYSLFDRLRQRPGLRASYLGCSRTASFARAGQSITQPFERDEYLYTVGDFEWFKFANRDTAFARDFRALLRNLRPQVVHFHHYINFGMEAFAHVREVLPDAKLILTLHEFLAICHQQGQMVTRHQGQLCRRSGQVECSRCFPEFQPADFFLRETYIGHFLRHVHHFISPSRFLAERYVAWGLPAERISVIENVPAATVRPSPARRVRLPGSELRAGFFGQISLLKGMQVLLDAAAALEGERRHDISFQIHGDQTNQPAAFQAAFLSQVEKAGSNVVFHGAYANADIDALMADVDVVLVPSIWWENSPVVIQEAFRNGVPVVCSNIGGMAEKVVPDETGLHFGVGSPRSLAGVLKALADDPDRLARLAAGAARECARLEGSVDELDAGLAATDPLGAHLRLYRDLRAPPPPRPAPRFALSREP